MLKPLFLGTSTDKLKTGAFAILDDREYELDFDSESGLQRLNVTYQQINELMRRLYWLGNIGNVNLKALTDHINAEEL